MENPWIVNDHESHTFDKDNLDEALRHKPGVDPFRAIITSSRPHIERKQQIEEFVSCLVRIHSLETWLEEYNKSPINDLKAVTMGTDVSEEQLETLLTEQKEEQHKSITHTKISLAIELQLFISLTESVISVEDKQKEEKLKELEEVNGSKLTLLNILRKELEPLHPDIFPKQPLVLEIDEDLTEESNPTNEKEIQSGQDEGVRQGQPLFPFNPQRFYQTGIGRGWFYSMHHATVISAFYNPTLFAMTQTPRQSTMQNNHAATGISLPVLPAESADATSSQCSLRMSSGSKDN